MNCWVGPIARHWTIPPSHPATPASVSFGGKHCWQRFSRGPADAPAVSQNGAAVVQSAFDKHSTHWLFVRLHFMAPASVHEVSLRHPVPHVWLPVWQTGPAAEVAQSLLVLHATQLLVVVSQTGVEVPAQSALLKHSTHRRVVGSHCLSETGQSVPPTRQPTHAPEVVSQIGRLDRGSHAVPPSTVHDGPHVCVAGEHTGVVPEPQSALVEH